MLMNTKRKKYGTRGSGKGACLPAATTPLIVGGQSARSKDGGNPPPKWALHYRRLLALRDRVLKERGDLAQNAVEETPNYSMDMADAATDEIDRDMALGQLSAEQDALYEIDQALKRIENGVYGKCELSGEPISEARLKAIPWTRFTQEAEARLERRGTVSRAHLGKLGSVHGVVIGDLEESEPGPEEAEPPPKDEALERTFSPPGKHWREIKNARRGKPQSPPA